MSKKRQLCALFRYMNANQLFPENAIEGEWEIFMLPRWIWRWWEDKKVIKRRGESFNIANFRSAKAKYWGWLKWEYDKKKNRYILDYSVNFNWEHRVVSADAWFGQFISWAGHILFYIKSIFGYIKHFFISRIIDRVKLESRDKGIGIFCFRLPIIGFPVPLSMFEMVRLN